MKKVFLILTLLVTAQLASAQSRPLLSRADFNDHKLDHEWVYIKFKEAKNQKENLLGRMIPLSDNQVDQPLSGVVKLAVPNGLDPVAYCNMLRQMDDFLYADPIVEYQLLSTPTDPLISNQYYLDNIRAFDAWGITTGDDDIIIGIIDSGLDLDHEDMVNNLWINEDDPIDGIDNDNNGFIDDYQGYDFADEDTDPNIQNGNHGMIVGGIAGASTNNGQGIAGVGYNTKVAALKGFRTANGTSNGLYDAITYAGENGFDVVNLSWGRMGSPLQSEQDIIDQAVLVHNMVVVAAAGNEGTRPTRENKWYPASYNNVLSVGASDAEDNKSLGSTYNYSVDILAPGVSMYSTVKNDGYANGGPGTSYSSPQVAATAALVKDQFPNLTALQIMERVRATADDVYDVGDNLSFEGKLGKGRLNVLRAVSESNVKSIRAENANLISKYGAVFFGDTVSVTAILTNYLAAISNPTITISSPDNNFSISQGTFQPGYLGTMDTKEVNFEIVLDDNIAPESTIGIRLDFNGTNYNDFQYLDVTTSPDYADFGNENLSMTIAGDGDLGFATYGPNFEGSGLKYGLDTLMSYTGLMLTTSSVAVSDNIIANYSSQTRGQDFSPRKNYKLYDHPGADYFGYSEFTDTGNPLIIEQSNITWNNKDFLIIRYRIINNSSSVINNLSLGIFADWDLDEKTANFASYDEIDNYSFTRNSSSNLFAGIQVLGGDNPEYSSLDMGTASGNSQDINNVFNDASKYDFLVNQNLLEAGSLGTGNDVATINGTTITELNAYEETYINVIYAIADSQANLENIFSDASDNLNDFLLKPRVLETFYTCDGTSITLDPSAGTNYEFYEDPLAQDLITSGSNFNPGVITKDTAFYVKNIDNLYKSDVFEIRLNLLNEIADFSMSTDTLYLDDFSSNVVSFSDQSQDAISWNWTFDEGTSSIIQNPDIFFSEIGTYSITLNIENALGCTDSFTKELVVANRPTPPTFESISICPGEDVIIDVSDAEKIHLFAFEDQLDPSISGTAIQVDAIKFDTTIYVSGVYGSFESEKVPFEIDVKEVAGQLSFAPDTTSVNHQIILSAIGFKMGSTIEWFIDDTPSGSTENIQMVAFTGEVNVRLRITSNDDCIKEIQQTISMSTSPFASQSNLVSCGEEVVTIAPENGTYFGFYNDPELTSLIKKGKQLITNEHSKVYIVSLDDGLPGKLIEVNIDNESPEVEISPVTTQVGEKYKVQLFANSNNEIDSWRWFINGEQSETLQNPTFFFNNEIYEVVLKVTTREGCEASDTLQLDFSPPLGAVLAETSYLYPNPSKGSVFFYGTSKIEELTVYSIDGKKVFTQKTPKGELDFSMLKKGLYIVKLNIGGQFIEQELLMK
ncbi:S8 family serine peptidase [Ekhidna sp.]